MSAWDYFLIALGYCLASLVGAVVGAVGGGLILLKALFKMHENSLPPKG